MTQTALDFSRNRVLDIHAHNRAALISAADIVARRLADAMGATCMPRVLRAMRELGYGPTLDSVDPRWSGAVLLPSRGWEKTGEYVPEGSRARPVPMWRRK